VCGSSARTDLYGGRSAMTVPTVTGTSTLAKLVEFKTVSKVTFLLPPFICKWGS
jgi:hypothetical protein